MAKILDTAIAAISPEKGYRRAVARAALSVMNNGTGYGNYGARPVSYTHLHPAGTIAASADQRPEQQLIIYVPFFRKLV